MLVIITYHLRQARTRSISPCKLPHCAVPLPPAAVRRPALSDASVADLCPVVARRPQGGARPARTSTRGLLSCRHPLLDHNHEEILVCTGARGGEGVRMGLQRRRHGSSSSSSSSRRCAHAPNAVRSSCLEQRMRKKLSSCCGRGNVRGSRVGEHCTAASRGGGGVNGSSSSSSSSSSRRPERQPVHQQQLLRRMRGAPPCLLRAARHIVSGPGGSLASGRSRGGSGGGGGGGSGSVGAGGCSAARRARSAHSPRDQGRARRAAPSVPASAWRRRSATRCRRAWSPWASPGAGRCRSCRR